jgi:hypothetical protein
MMIFYLMPGILSVIWLLNGANGLTKGEFRFVNQWVYGQLAHRMGAWSIIVGMIFASGLASIDYGGAGFWFCGAWLLVPGIIAATIPSDEKKSIDYDHPFWVFLRRGGSDGEPDKGSADHDR